VGTTCNDSDTCTPSSACQPDGQCYGATYDCAPPAWICDPSYFLSGICARGCGVTDPTCTSTNFCFCTNQADTCPEAQSPPLSGLCDDIQQGWLCPVDWYDTDDGCDCGCGIWDPDCADRSGASCEFCGFASCGFDGSGTECTTINPSDNAVCGSDIVPPEWLCDPSAYGGGNGCDCGCGLIDPDCAAMADSECDQCPAGSCSAAGCATVATNNNAVCGTGVPASWRLECSNGWYGTGDGCDCGCGAPDPDCASPSSDECIFVSPVGECADGAYNPDNNAVCHSGIPSDWTCSADKYSARDGCDCGCGAVDPDCDSPANTDCDNCETCGDCTNVSELTNANCEKRAPPTAWNCDANRYDDGTCDCGCGAVDADCASALRAVCTDCSQCGGDCATNNVAADANYMCL
jgi:hypothetical protein